jgi:hypothetical protein
MNGIAVRFRACPPKPWTGRYARVVGDETVFHLRHVDGELWPVVVWKTEGGTGTCPAIASPAVFVLAGAVAHAKRALGGSGGGAFLIDEYGRVLVPGSMGDGRRALAGHIEGIPLFKNPFDPGETIDLSDYASLAPGDPWPLPYVGIPYNLHVGGHLYFYQIDASGGRSLYPVQQDRELIKAIRRVRPSGPVRILVNPAGAVLTKAPCSAGCLSGDSWHPVFVGSINPSSWFAKE